MPRRPKGFDYQRYLASREWAQKREEVRLRSGNRCEHCFNAPQQAVHHLTYERIGNENLSDLMAICNPCHEYLSGKSNDNPRWGFGVVSARLLIRRYDVESYGHYFIPYDSREPKPWPIRLVWCAGDGCIWCKDVDPVWALFLGGAVFI